MSQSFQLLNVPDVSLGTEAWIFRLNAGFELIAIMQTSEWELPSSGESNE